MPCSSYLASQSTYLAGFPRKQQMGHEVPAYLPKAWAAGFGRSLDCNLYIEDKPGPAEKRFLGCSANDTFPGDQLLGFQPQIPPGVFYQGESNHTFGDVQLDRSCCGRCQFHVDHIRIYYFADPEAPAICQKRGSKVKIWNAPLQDQGKMGNRSIANTLLSAVSRPPVGSVATVRGVEMTSPSIYLEFAGPMTMADKCGQIGKVLDTKIVPFNARYLATVHPTQNDLDAGGEKGETWDVVGDLDFLDPVDLECPTNGYGRSTRGDGEVVTTVGAPWLPLIYFTADQLSSIEPQWDKVCAGKIDDLEFAQVDGGKTARSFALFDPPIFVNPGDSIEDPVGGRPLPQAAHVTEDPAVTRQPEPGKGPDHIVPATAFKGFRPLHMNLKDKPALPQETGAPKKDPSAETKDDTPTKATPNDIPDPAQNADNPLPAGSRGQANEPGSSDPKNAVPVNNPPPNNPPPNNPPPNNPPPNRLPPNNPPENNAPANADPALNVPANNVPANNVPANNVPANIAPGNTNLGGSNAVDPNPVNNVPVNNAPANNVPVNGVPSDPNPGKTNPGSNPEITGGEQPGVNPGQGAEGVFVPGESGNSQGTPQNGQSLGNNGAPNTENAGNNNALPFGDSPAGQNANTPGIAPGQGTSPKIVPGTGGSQAFPNQGSASYPGSLGGNVNNDISNTGGADPVNPVAPGSGNAGGVPAHKQPGNQPYNGNNAESNNLIPGTVQGTSAVDGPGRGRFDDPMTPGSTPPNTGANPGLPAQGAEAGVPVGRPAQPFNPNVVATNQGATPNVAGFQSPNAGNSNNGNSRFATPGTGGGNAGSSSPVPDGSNGNLEPSEVAAVQVGDTKVHLGEAPVMIGGQPVSVDRSGNLAVGPSTYNVADPAAPVQEIDVGGKPVNVNAQYQPPSSRLPQVTAVQVGDTQIRPGEAPVMVGGQPVSVDNSGNLAIGSSNYNVADPGAPIKQVDVGGKPVSVNAQYNPGINPDPISPPVAAVQVGDTKIFPGGAPVNVGGQPVSVDRSGNLAVGPSTYNVADPSSPVQRINVGGKPLDVSAQFYNDGSQTGQSPANEPYGNGQNTSPPQSQIVDVAGQQIAANPNGFVAAGKPVLPGGPPVVVSGTSVSLDTNGILSVGDGSSHDSKQIDLNQNSYNTPTSSENTVNIAGQTIEANPSGFVVDKNSILPGAPPVDISGTPISLDKNGVLHVGSTTKQLTDPIKQQSNIFTAGDQTITADPAGFAIGSTSVLPGKPAVTIDGTPIALGTDGALRVGDSTRHLSSPTDVPNVIEVGGQSITADPTGFVLAGTTLSPGGPGATVSGTPISLGASGLLNIGGSTTQLAPASATENIVTVGDHTITANPAGFEIAGSTISPGGSAVTISGTPISLEPSGVLHIGTSTTQLSPASTTPATDAQPFTVDGMVFTPAPSASAVVVNGTTVSRGGAETTVDGTRVNFGGDGSLTVGDETVAVPTPTEGGDEGVMGTAGVGTAGPTATTTRAGSGAGRCVSDWGMVHWVLMWTGFWLVWDVGWMGLIVGAVY